MPNFTPFQQKAIHFEGKNLLVSAGAGSGKTAVLTERVIRKLEMGIAINALVILTFTNAAAMEMKQRIRQEIESRPLLHPQLMLLDQAMIGTFDSFARRIIEEHHALLNRPKTIQLVDSLELKRIKDHLLELAIDETIARATEAKQETLLRLFDHGDALIQSGVTTLFEGIDKLLDPIDYLDHYQEHQGSLGQIHHQFTLFIEYLKQQIRSFQQAFYSFDQKARHFHDPKLDSYCEGVNHVVEELLQVTTYDEFVHVTSRSLPVLRKVDPEIKAVIDPKLEVLKQRFKDLKAISKRLFSSNQEEAVSAVIQSQAMVQIIVEITRDFTLRYQQTLQEQRLDTFQTLFRDVLRLFREHPKLQQHYQQRYQEIMVDEYQDTNDFQEWFLSYISNNNVFFVGDVKQSIYAFRNANPNHFIQKTKNYLATQKGEVVFLPDNFRSRKEIISGINSFFSTLMSEELGGVDYQAGHALAYGQKGYESENFSSSTYGIQVANYSFHADLSSRAYQEGEVIALDIRAKIAAKTPIFHKGTFRNVRYRDFAIIVDRKTDFFEYLKALNDQGIPVNMIADESFRAQAEIQTATNALKLYHCFIQEDFSSPFFQRAFYGFARSYVCQIDDDDIVNFLLDLKATDSGKDFFASHPTFQLIYEKFSSLIELQNRMSLDQMLSKIYQSFDFIEQCVYLEDPHSAVEKLLFLLEKIQSMQQFGLEEAISYVEAMEQKSELDIEYQKPLDFELDAVILLTMHKSKGLEFPICYYPGLTKQFHSPETKAFFLFEPHLGLIAKAFEHGYYDTFQRLLYTQKLKQNELSERVRLLYVALTRAKEQAILLYDQSQDEENEELEIDSPPHEELLRVRSFMQLIQTSPDFAHWPRLRQVQSPSLIPKQQERIATTPPLLYERTLLARDQGDDLNERLVMESPSLSLYQKEGTHLHQLLELTDIKQKKLPNLDMTSWERKLLQAFLDSPWLETAEIIRVYHEYALLDQENHIAIIDCLIEYPEKYLVIDFKTKNIGSQDYQEQVKRYLQALQTFTSKPIRGVLYSLIEGETEWITFT